MVVRLNVFRRGITHTEEILTAEAELFMFVKFVAEGSSSDRRYILMGQFGNRGGFGGGNYNRGPVEKHKAVCSDCKKECEVPFKPTEGRTVFCKECYPKHSKKF